VKNRTSSIKYSIGCFMLGFLSISILAIPQKILLNADPFAIEGFVAPVLVGGPIGMLLGLALRKIRSENQEIKRAHKKLAERNEQYQRYFELNHAAMLLIDPETAEIVDANPAACRFYGYDKSQLTDRKISDINLLNEDEIKQEMQKAKENNCNYFNFKNRLASGEIRDVEVYSGPIEVGKRSLIYSVIHDVTERKANEAEREALIAKLKEALAEIKTLSGMLPICANCKKIRDDEGYWQQIEEYIGSHSDAVISHSICPDCMRKLYPEYIAKGQPADNNPDEGLR
jgi:PAS domain S-box-containing protein